MTTFSAREIFSDSRFRLIVIESVDIQPDNTTTYCRVWGNLKPLALVIYGPDTSYALDMDAKPVAFDQLRQVIPELDTIISPHNPP